MLKDPGAVPSVTLGIRWTSDDGKDDLNIVADAINGGQWGYNNLQWIGFTYYHKLNDYWHIAFETWNHPREQCAEPQQCRRRRRIVADGGTPFSPQFMPFNAPNAALCAESPTVLTCTADTQTFPALPQLFAEQAEQLFASRRMVRRHERTAHRSCHPLYRHRGKLAALVVAADRDASRNRLLSLARRPGVQWQRQCRHCSRPGIMRSSRPAT